MREHFLTLFPKRPTMYMVSPSPVGPMLTCRNRNGCGNFHWGACGPLNQEGAVTTIEERVIQIVCDNLGVNREQVTRKTSFQDDIGADSLDVVELVMELETEFEITIPDEEAERIRTVGEAIEYVEREVASRRNTAANS